MTAPMTREELLPCPFCGSGCHLADTGNKWISCNSCDAEGPVRATEQDAIKAWNVRAGVAQTVPSAWRYKCQDGQFVFMENRLTDEQKALGYYLDDDEDYGDEGDRGPFQWSDETPLFEGASK